MKCENSFVGAVAHIVCHQTLVLREREIVTIMLSVLECWSVAVITVHSFPVLGMVRMTVVRGDVLRTGHVDRGR